MTNQDIIDKLLSLSLDKQREVLNALLDYEWSDEISSDLEELLNDC